VFEERVPGDETKVAKNDHYWQAGLPHLDNVVFKIATDTTSRGSALKAGDLNAIEVSDSALLKTMVDLEDSGEFQLFTTAGQETDESVIALNTSKAPFDDLVARQALAYAIDQDTIAEQAYEGMYPPAWGNFEEGSPFYISREEAGYPEPDLAKARELAGQYERDHGTPLSFTFLAGSDTTLLSIAQYLQQTLSEAGIEMRIESGESASIITRVITGDYEASTFGMWSTPTLDKGYPFVATEPVTGGLSLNYTKLVDPELFAAMDEARATDDEAAQTEAWGKAQQRMAANLDRIFLVHPRYAIASSPDVHGFTKATFPGTDERAFNPTIVNPFLSSVWMSES
jgi:peptide/nickel transport system substrate-binding protein